MPDWSEFWWTSITGPLNLCEAVANTIQSNKTVCLVIPDDLPWRDEMRACIENKMHQKASMESFYVEFIDVEDQCPDIPDIGRYLLERYATPSAALGYRRRQTIQEYLLQKKVLEKRVLWIKGMSREQEKKWLQFCKEYIPAEESDGKFVLEIRWSDMEYEQNASLIRYEDTINQYDLTLFNNIYLNREKRTYSPLWQQYIAIVCSTLCEKDSETSKALIDRCDFAAGNFISSMQVVAMDRDLLRRGESNRSHILSLVREQNVYAIEKLIWKAQVQVLFPLIELERISFVEKYKDEIQSALNTEYLDYDTGSVKRIDQFGEILEDPNDAEIGTLYRMTRLKQYCSNQYLLNIYDRESRQRIELLHDLRNTIAHGKSCSIDKVKEFIDGYPFIWFR